MTRLRRHVLALVLAAASGAAGHAIGEHVTTRRIEAALVNAYASGVVRGWASCWCWERDR